MKIDLLQQLKNRRRALTDYFEGSEMWPADTLPPNSLAGMRRWSLPQYGIVPLGSKSSTSQSAHLKWTSEAQRVRKLNIFDEIGGLEGDLKRVQALLRGKSRSRRRSLSEQLTSARSDKDQAIRDRDAALARYSELLGKLEQEVATRRSLERQCDALKRDSERLQERINEFHGFPKVSKPLRAVPTGELPNESPSDRS